MRKASPSKAALGPGFRAAQLACEAFWKSCTWTLTFHLKITISTIIITTTIIIITIIIVIIIIVIILIITIGIVITGGPQGEAAKRGHVTAYTVMLRVRRIPYKALKGPYEYMSYRFRVWGLGFRV